MTAAILPPLDDRRNIIFVFMRFDLSRGDQEAQSAMSEPAPMTKSDIMASVCSVPVVPCYLDTFRCGRNDAISSGDYQVTHLMYDHHKTSETGISA